jgi:hypothetical protein
LGGIRNSNVLVGAARLATDAHLTCYEIGDIVKEINARDTENAQLFVVDRTRQSAEMKQRMSHAAGGPPAISYPVRAQLFRVIGMLESVLRKHATAEALQLTNREDAEKATARLKWCYERICERGENAST